MAGPLPRPGTVAILIPRPLLPPPGSVVGQRLSDHPDVRKIAFTGSTEVGKHIMKR